MSGWSSVDDDEGLAQAPEYPTEDDVVPAPAPRRGSPPPAPTLSTESLLKPSSPSAQPSRLTTEAATSADAAATVVTPMNVRDEGLSDVSRSSSRYSPSVLRAMSEQRRLERQQQQRRAARSSTDQGAGETPRASTPAAAAAEDRHSRQVSPSRSQGRGNEDSEPPSPGIVEGSPTDSAVVRRRSLQARRRSEQAFGDSLADRHLRAEQLFLINYELEGRNEVVRDEGDELAEILKQFKLFQEILRSTASQPPLAPLPLAHITNRAPTVETPAAEARRTVADPPVASSPSSSVFTITTIYRRPQLSSSSASGPIVSVPLDSDRAYTSSAPYAPHTPHDGSKREGDMAQTTPERSPHRLRVMPAILYVQLPPSWWLALSEGGEAMMRVGSYAVQRLIDLCVLSAALLGVLLIGAFCDIVWWRMGGASRV